MRDCLAILGMHPGCSLGQARERFRSLAKVLHPDKCKTPGAEQRFIEMREAMSAIEADPRLLLGSKSVTARTQGQHTRVSVDVDIRHLFFEKLASVAVRKKGRCNCCKGTGSSDLSFHPCALCDGSGSIKGSIMRLSGSNACPQCSGSGIHVPDDLKCRACKGASLVNVVDIVEIPTGPGTPDGQVIILPGRGEAGAFQGECGDLCVKVHVIPYPGLEFYHGRITIWVDASPAQFVVGDSFTIPLMDEVLIATVPPLTGRAEVLFKEKNVLVRLNLVMPVKVDAIARSLYGRILALEQGKEYLSEKSSESTGSKGSESFGVPAPKRKYHSNPNRVRRAKANGSSRTEVHGVKQGGRGNGTSTKPPAGKR